ncbi:MAG: hypothetical protein R3B68_11520 [Phycisphaerales bacterium]
MPDHLVLYNTLTRKAEAFRPRDPRRITFYTCGPTVYDDAHIGNFRSFLAADVLRRFLESPLCRLANDAGGPALQAGSGGGPALQAGSGGGPALQAGSRTVLHVMNITDVGHMTDDDAADGAGEDKMAAATRRLAEAKKSGKLPPGAGDIDPTDQHAIARFYEARFLEDARRLGLRVAIDAQRDPTLMPRATDAVPGMIAVIERLIERGHAYAVGPAGRQTVYFSVPSFPAYGSLSGNTLDALRAGQGGRVQESHQAEKKHPADFLLWKSDPSHAMRWASPWGEGYPGWHIECTAMAAARLCAADDGSNAVASPLTPAALAALEVADARPMIDLHSGGEDNIFPHHECEIAQSCGAFNASPADAAPARGMFAAHWFHPRFLMVEGAKMSKSKGNFFTARDLFAKGHEPAAVRLELIKTHYRSNANFTEQGLKDSARTWRRWTRRIAAAGASALTAHSHGELEQHRRAHREILAGQERFADALFDDLNVALAIAVVQETFDAFDRVMHSVDAGELVSPDGTLHLIEMDSLVDQIRGLGSQTLAATNANALLCMLDVLGLTDCRQPGVIETEFAVYVHPAKPTIESEEALGARRDARLAKDFARSDAIRDQLSAMGLAVKDVRGGKPEVRKG